MSNKNVFMFSGQGSQYYKMGKELYLNNSTFKYWMDTCSEIVEPLLKTSLTDIIYDEDKRGVPFDRLLYTNPALLSIQYSMFQVLKDVDVHPDFLMGYSLGEIAALIVSGAVALEDGLKLVVEMANVVEEKTSKATMLAIMADKMIMVEYPDFFSQCWLIGTNFSGNFVVCGLPKNITDLQQLLIQKGITTQILPVNEGFHTPLIDSFETDFKKQVGSIQFSEIEIPIISSRKATVVEELNSDYFWDVIRYPINFQRTVENILKEGDFTFIDLGPSGSLATSVKYILPPNSRSTQVQILNQYGRNLTMLERFTTSLSM